MFEQISKLMAEAGASQMQIIVKSVEGTDNIMVTVVSMLSPTTTKESAQALQLRAALSQPLTVVAPVGEIDVNLSVALTQFAETYTQGARVHSNLLDLKASIETASKSVVTPASAANEQAVATTDNTNGDLASTFFTGEANSL